MSPAAQPNTDLALRTAIEQARLVRLNYKGRERIIEPHDYGIHNGVSKLLAFQIAGPSSGKPPNWRWFETALISDIIVLEQTFAGGRPPASGTHHKWDRVFARVKSKSD